MKRRRLNQSGAVALLTVALFATIITVIVIAYARSAVNQQQESLNYDLSNRAYYAAETGVQDAVRALNAANAGDANSLINTGQTTCKNGSSFLPSGDGNLGNNLGYTCQLITVNPTSVEGDTAKGPLMISLKPQAINTGATYTLRFTWSPKTSGAQETLVARSNANQLFPTIANWKVGSNRIHPLVKAEFISPKVPSTRADIAQQVYFLNPLTRTAGRENAVALNPTAPSYTVRANAIPEGSCYASNGAGDYGGYSCQKTFTFSGSLFADRDFYIRVNSIYASTKFRVSLERNGTAQSLANAPPIIEVTGRANNVFRRIRQSMPNGSNVTYASWPDAALAAGDGFCKLLEVATSTADYTTACTAEGLYSP